MKVVGLITEYNPFHNGHLYHIEQAKNITGADKVIVVMSGDFVQRGTPAIMPKHLRTEMALRCGANAVFELPVCYATGSAETFALGAISLLEQLGVADSICFGSECNNLSEMQQIADILLEEPAEYQCHLQAGLKKGLSYPSARENALRQYMNNDCFRILSSPNNILGIEYLKALKIIESSMIPYSIQRTESNYHDTELRSRYSSASSIRNLLSYSGEVIHTVDLERQVPASCLQLLRDNHKLRYPVYQNDFSLLLKYRLMRKSAKNLRKYQDMSRELANRIQNKKNNYIHYDQFCELLKTKELTYTRINRALLHVILNIKEDDLKRYKKSGYHFYARLLGFQKSSQSILTAISKNSTLPLLTKLTSTEDISKLGLHMLEQDLFASDLYESAVAERYTAAFESEFQKQIVIL